MAAAVYAVFGTWYSLVVVGAGYDSHAYWAAGQHLDHLYDSPPLSRNAYLYSPLFAQVLWPVARLPWPAFWAVWSAATAACCVWLLRPLPARWMAPAIVATVPEVLTGNIYAFMATALALGVSRGTPWLFLGLTKVTPGLVGAVWLLGTRQLGALVRGLSVGGVLVAVSYLGAPEAWRDWVGFLEKATARSAEFPGGPMLTLALLGVGLVVTVCAAFTRRRWLLAVAVVLASPTLGLNTLILLAAVPRLCQSEEASHHIEGLDREPKRSRDGEG